MEEEFQDTLGLLQWKRAQNSSYILQSSLYLLHNMYISIIYELHFASAQIILWIEARM